MTDYHFTAHFFFMRCECAVSGHCARIDLSFHLSLESIGSMMVKVVTATVVGGVVGVMGVIVGLVAMATTKV